LVTQHLGVKPITFCDQQNTERNGRDAAKLYGHGVIPGDAKKPLTGVGAIRETLLSGHEPTRHQPAAGSGTRTFLAAARVRRGEALVLTGWEVQVVKTARRCWRQVASSGR
jgi:hypothetical protein